MRDDPRVLATAPGDEAGATGRTVSRLTAFNLLAIHHAVSPFGFPDPSPRISMLRR